MGDNQACCAHLRVDYKPIDQGDGTVRSAWACSTCTWAFNPAPPKPAVEVQDAGRPRGEPTPCETPHWAKELKQRDKQRLATVDECLKDRDYFSDKLEKQEAACKQQQASIEELETRLFHLLRRTKGHFGKDWCRWIEYTEARAALAKAEGGKLMASEFIEHALNVAEKLDRANATIATLREQVERMSEVIREGYRIAHGNPFREYANSAMSALAETGNGEEG